MTESGNATAKSLVPDLLTTQRDIVELERTSREKALIEALSDKAPLLARCYTGSLQTLNQIANPDRFALAAHGLREIIEKLPEQIVIELPAHHENLKQQVRTLNEKWDQMLRNTQARINGEWNDRSDKHLRSFLDKLLEFFSWFEQSFPRRKKEIAAVLTRLDGAHQPLPEPLQEHNVDYWDAMKTFFVSVCHHRKVTDDTEFRRWLVAFEDFLLNRLRPRTYADYDEIDGILTKGRKE